MRHLLLVVSLAATLQVSAQGIITNVLGRNTFSLNGKWNYIIDPYETGYYDYRYEPYDKNPNPSGGYFLDKHAQNKSELLEYDFDKCPTLMVPKDWNSQDARLLYYEGTIWYRRLFDYKKSNPANRVFVYFGAANYETDVYLNGKKLGKHIGGFTPFTYEITSLLKDEKNSLVVKVDNKRKREGVPTLNTDWWNYGGITRDVMIVELPVTFISDYFIQLKKGSKNLITGYVRLDGIDKNQKIKIEIPELKTVAEFTTDKNGVADISIPVKKYEAWSPASPKLYQVNVSCETDKVSE
ncbi:MAG TPA: sugar-binding domain-containing protein, partial [Bacteroidales bacterium]